MEKRCSSWRTTPLWKNTPLRHVSPHGLLQRRHLLCQSHTFTCVPLSWLLLCLFYIISIRRRRKLKKERKKYPGLRSAARFVFFFSPPPFTWSVRGCCAGALVGSHQSKMSSQVEKKHPQTKRHDPTDLGGESEDGLPVGPWHRPRTSKSPPLSN